MTVILSPNTLNIIGADACASDGLMTLNETTKSVSFVNVANGHARR